MTGANDYAGLLSGSGNVVDNDDGGDSVALLTNVAVTVTGAGGAVYLAGSGDTVTASNETVGTAANDQNETVSGTGDTIFESANNGFNVAGGLDTVDMTGADDYAGLLSGSGDVVDNDDGGDSVALLANVAVTVTGAGGAVYLAGSGDNVTASNETVGTAANDQNETVSGTGDTIFETANNGFNVAGGFDTVDMTGPDDYAGLLSGSGDVVDNDDAGDNVNLTASTSATVSGTGGDIGLVGSSDTVTASNETINTVANDQGETVTGTGDTINGASNASIDVVGGSDTINLASNSDYLAACRTYPQPASVAES
jgi:hypothetical protein